MMTDKEIVNYFSTASHQVCGRFSTTQLNKDLPLREEKKRFSFTYLWNLLLAGFLVTESSCEESMTGKVSVEQPPARVTSMGDTIIVEQPPTTKGEVAVIDSPDPVPPTDITGNVTDENNGKPVPDVTVMIKGANTGTITDSLGNFHLSVEKKDRVILIFSSLGYKTETRILNDQTNWNAVKVSLRESNEVLTGLVIAHTPPKHKRSKTQK
jgi:hypothetical protein